MNSNTLKLLAIPAAFLVVYIIIVIYTTSGSSSTTQPIAKVTAPVKDITQAKAIVYVSSSCEECRRAIKMLQLRGVPYYVYNIDTSKPGLNNYIQLSGYRTPLILLGKKRLDGYQAADLSRAIREMK